MITAPRISSRRYCYNPICSFPETVVIPRNFTISANKYITDKKSLLCWPSFPVFMDDPFPPEEPSFDAEGKESRTGFGPESKRFRTSVAGASSLSAAIPQVVAAVSGRRALDLEPLYSAVDPDALEALFGAGMTGRVAFEYEGYDIIVDDHGAIALTPTVELGGRSVPQR